MRQLIKKVLQGVGSLYMVSAGLAYAGVPAEPNVNTHSLFYDFTLIADTGSQFTSLGSAPSINKSGMVAFQGHIGAGDGIWASNGRNTVDATIGFHSATRTFSRAVMISDTGYIVANDRVPGAPPPSFERIWPTASGATGTVIGRGGATQTYAAVLSHPALSANGQAWAYTALDQVSTAIWLVMPQGRTQLLGNRSTGYRPMVADDGSAVLRDGDTAKLQIQVYNSGNPTNPQVLASTASGYSDLGNQPGISDDGKVVAFLGNRGYGPGLFIAYRNGASWTIVRVVGEGAAAQGSRPELGFDISDNPVYFSQLDFDSRVSVIHQEGGKLGMEGDTVVVSFVGTPSGVSAYPRFGHYPGLFFRQSLGLWTMRVDFRLDSTAKLQPFRRFALPVVQVGDTIDTVGLKGFVVSALGVHDSLAGADSDDQGQALTHAAGSHRVALWANDASGKQVILRATHVNSCVLPIRHFSQCDARWGSSPYPPPPDTFCGKACALTSFTMAANYGADFYGVNSTLTPLSAFNIIQPLQGVTNGGKMNWVPAVRALTQPPGPLSQTPASALHYAPAGHNVNPASSAQDVTDAVSYLDQNLCDDNNPAPVIVGVNRKFNSQNYLTARHFILISGRANDRHFISDPGHNTAVLFSQGPIENPVSIHYDNNFETRGTIVDPVDLSGLSILIDGPVEPLISESSNRLAGALPNRAEPVNQIPNAAFYHEAVEDPLLQSPLREMGSSFQMMRPPTAPLSVQVRGVGNGQFQLTVTMTASDGALLKPVVITDTIATNQLKSYVVTPSAGGAVVTVPGVKPGDIDGDGDVDQDDINMITQALNQRATSPTDARDLDKDGVISVLDARKAVTLCTRPRCATR